MNQTETKFQLVKDRRFQGFSGSTRVRRLLRLAVSVGLFTLGVSLALAQVGLVERVSVGNLGEQSDGASAYSDISADGRFVAFESNASNFIFGGTNPYRNIFVRDRVAGTTRIVSLSSDGQQANAACFAASISGNGRLIAFSSAASNLVPGDTNGHTDVFVHDVVTGITVRASVSSAGEQANRGSVRATLSNNGRYVVFTSEATNLVSNDLREVADVFVHDLHTRHTTRASFGPDEFFEPSGYGTSDITDDGRFVAFATRTDLRWQVVIGDQLTLENYVASVSSAGVLGNGNSGFGAVHMSADGRFVAFQSTASNLVPGDTNQYDVFVHDRQSGTTSKVSVGTGGYHANGRCDVGSISADGRYVTFWSAAKNLLPGSTDDDADIFLHDRLVGVTRCVSVPRGDQHQNDQSYRGVISANGRYVAFESFATNMVAGDTNNFADVFIVKVRPEPSDEGYPYRLVPDEGEHFLGSTDACDESDDVYFGMFNDADTLGATLRVETVTERLSPSSIQFAFESSAGRPGLAREIRFFNYDLGTYTTLAGFVAGLGDVTDTVVITVNPSAYISEGGDMRTQVSWRPLNDEDPSQDGWILRADYAHWTLE